MEFINVLENPYPLYELCKDNGWYEGEDEDFDALEFFEGDPDMIKINGEVGYFCKCDGNVYYWFDNFDGSAETMLKKFFETYKTGVTIGGEGYAIGENPEGVVDVHGDGIHPIWNIWENMETGIAFRGGGGYTYWISDWSEWQKKNLHNERVAS